MTNKEIKFELAKVALTTCQHMTSESLTESLKNLYDWIMEEPVENSAWSEEDEKIYQSILDDTVTETQLGDKQITWLKSLKERVQPQSNQEWSYGDEAHLHSLITHLEQWIERHPNTTGADIQGENIAWLKSIRPQNTWKPSKRQKEALLWCVVHLGGADKQTLGELLEALNKL